MNRLDESFLYIASQCFPEHYFSIQEDDLLMDGKYLCPYTIQKDWEVLKDTSFYNIDAEAESYSRQFEEMERLTGFVKETKWAEDNC